MTSLSVTTLRIEAAELGSASPLPPLHPPRYIANSVSVDESVPAAARRYLGYGCDTGCLPYSEQDTYARRRTPHDFRVAVLENDTLRATFLLSLGGRLWSLVHKSSGRELLYVNKIIQPTNQAVRGAWFSGGVEWNMSVRGHSPFTCSPLFARKVTDRDGGAMLRMYEWDRVRRVPFVIDCSLPAQSQFLIVRVRLHNPHDETIPMYWWSNIAVPETPDVRVLVPTDHSYRYGYHDRLKRIRIPIADGSGDGSARGPDDCSGGGPDATYATNLREPADYFFDLPESRRPWITALDQSGCGIIQTSTARLRGRKMFVWGMGAGGRRWQRFLTESDKTYLEIQAGLAQTQYECLPMPPRTQWAWMEAYGLLQADPAVVHGEDWGAACNHIAAELEEMLPAVSLERTCTADPAWPDLSAGDVLQNGSGWAALEYQRIEAAATRTGDGAKADTEPVTNEPVTNEMAVAETAAREAIASFPRESLGQDQQPWLQLLEQGTFPCPAPSESPGAHLVGDAWRQLLLNAVSKEASDHWFSWLHLGVMAYHAEDTDAAYAAWQRSVALEPSAWAYRNLAVLAKDEGNPSKAAELYRQAHQLLPDQPQIAIELGQTLLDCQDYEAVQRFVSELSEHVQNSPRIRLLAAQAQIHTGDVAAIESLLDTLASGKHELPDLREGETVLTDLWFEAQTHRLGRELGQPVSAAIRAQAVRQFPPPAEIDFRMGEEEE